LYKVVASTLLISCRELQFLPNSSINPSSSAQERGDGKNGGLVREAGCVFDA